MTRKKFHWPDIWLPAVSSLPDDLGRHPVGCAFHGPKNIALTHTKILKQIYKHVRSRKRLLIRGYEKIMRPSSGSIKRRPNSWRSGLTPSHIVIGDGSWLPSCLPFLSPAPAGFSYQISLFSRSLQITILEQEPITRSKKLCCAHATVFSQITIF